MSKRPITDVLSEEDEEELERRRVRLRVEAAMRFHDIMLPEIQHEIADLLVAMTYEHDAAGRTIMDMLTVDHAFYILILAAMRRRVNALLDAAKTFFRTWEMKVPLADHLRACEDVADQWHCSRNYVIAAVLFQNRTGTRTRMDDEEPEAIPLAPLTDMYLLHFHGDTIREFWKEHYPMEELPDMPLPENVATAFRNEPWEYVALKYWLYDRSATYAVDLKTMFPPFAAENEARSLVWMADADIIDVGNVRLGCEIYLSGNLASNNDDFDEEVRFQRLDKILPAGKDKESYQRLFPTIMDLARYILRVDETREFLTPAKHVAWQIIARQPPRAPPAKDPAPARLAQVVVPINETKSLATWMQFMYPSELTDKEDHARFLTDVRRLVLNADNSEIVQHQVIYRLSWEDKVALMAETTPAELPNDYEMTVRLIDPVFRELLTTEAYTVARMKAFLQEARLVHFPGNPPPRVTDDRVKDLLHIIWMHYYIGSGMVRRNAETSAILLELEPNPGPMKPAYVIEFLQTVRDCPSYNEMYARWLLENSARYGYDTVALAMRFFAWQLDADKLKMWLSIMDKRYDTFMDQLLQAGLPPVVSRSHELYASDTWMPYIRRNSDFSPDEFIHRAIAYLGTPRRVLQWMINDDRFFFNNIEFNVKLPLVASAEESIQLLDMFCYAINRDKIEDWYRMGRDVKLRKWQIGIIKWAGTLAAQSGKKPVEIMELLVSIYTSNHSFLWLQRGTTTQIVTSIFTTLQPLSNPPWSVEEVDRVLNLFKPPPLQ